MDKTFRTPDIGLARQYLDLLTSNCLWLTKSGNPPRGRSHIRLSGYTVESKSGAKP